MIEDESSPAPEHRVNPPPRRRPSAAVAPAQAQVPPKPKRDYEIGYKKPPVKHQFKIGNKGGGRKKGRKSQDTLMREQFLKERVVRSAGRAKKTNTLELLNTLNMEGALKDRSPRHIAALLLEARRLFPDEAPQVEGAKAHDPEADRAILRELTRMFSLGEPDPNRSDPLGDACIGSPDLGERGTGSGWDEGDWGAPGEEQSDAEA